VGGDIKCNGLVNVPKTGLLWVKTFITYDGKEILLGEEVGKG